jgi:hypothetical protein
MDSQIWTSATFWVLGYTTFHPTDRFRWLSGAEASEPILPIVPAPLNHPTRLAIAQFINILLQ